MTLGNMRALGVQRLVASCLIDACRHQGLIDVSGYPGGCRDPPAKSGKCGGRGVDVLTPDRVPHHADIVPGSKGGAGDAPLRVKPPSVEKARALLSDSLEPAHISASPAASSCVMLADQTCGDADSNPRH
jgi:hypothetical protein